MSEETALLERYHSVQNRIAKAVEQAGRKQGSVALLAVSKTKPVEMIAALAKAGQSSFGENYLQEALPKIAQHPELEWHFIGPIQSNKTKPIAENFAWVHSVDRLKIAERLSHQRPAALGNLQILLEVNISHEASKAGFSPDELIDAAKQVAQLPNLTLRGLMAIPEISDDPQQQRAVFAQMKALLQQLQNALPDLPLDTLSMGMSGDLEAAILEGATIVRIGTDIFGARSYPQTATQSTGE
ncbi:YggS family pyridoxal phosphate-dependent enzyme [Thiomicrorhabdus cannonii]|uniref:YggS family pyridoxal phosphate-dependent enzyme n=1 Tax=Thiomicrorhabdus cannonii TaxID=2748011 RepID=UPI0015BFB7E3|nr:YggS family pyridoxal phosphate-dependent enzyme [Thiomicrorhabdus cannonii]